jgi:CO/xanthine dehydrogenase FAD-binding subunit
MKFEQEIAMKPAPFEYLKAGTVEEAVAWLESLGESAKILAGGQSLLPMMKLRLARPGQLIDINGIASLSQIEENELSLKIGALVRHHQLEEDETVRKQCPILSTAAGVIGHPQIRHRGTIGGSLSHADPCAELPTVLTALEGSVIVQGPQENERNIRADDFFISYLTTSINENEIVTAVLVPKTAPDTGWSFMEISDIDGGLAVVCVAAILEITDDGICRQAKVALGGVASIPFRAAEAERLLENKPIDELLIDEAAQVIMSAVEPESDMLHTADHKRTLAGTLARRALKEALQRAKAKPK